MSAKMPIPRLGALTGGTMTIRLSIPVEISFYRYLRMGVV